MPYKDIERKIGYNGGYVYLIHCDDSTYYKIGITYCDIEHRVRALQTGCPHKLIMVMAFWTPNPESLEFRLHEKFKECRVCGEWFDFDPQSFCDFILEINSMMVGYVPPTD